MAKSNKDKQVNINKKLTKIFVWVMLFSMVGIVFITAILNLLVF
ncbi:Protein of unknown function [Carnobacterium iners]|uniref:DUF4044 domain-containing protein n=1 Tax=Carnobacterium iners TaxID=1073423 RepID=A0A1X7NR47_9LACT|nr:DUF4044 domain-containing protein [Carnobacterium iners]SEL16534.1 Protein of unknown function [Carnobacterium iners]SMH40527.1 Protein of unknown function [Carnobacterium iners]